MDAVRDTLSKSKAWILLWWAQLRGRLRRAAQAVPDRLRTINLTWISSNYRTPDGGTIYA
ncbi:MAG: hypothetical protein R3C44_05510 [Chloroflexota bacterium]